MAGQQITFNFEKEINAGSVAATNTDSVVTKNNSSELEAGRISTEQFRGGLPKKVPVGAESVGTESVGTESVGTESIFKEPKTSSDKHQGIVKPLSSVHASSRLHASEDSFETFSEWSGAKDRSSLLDQLRQQTGCIQHAADRTDFATFSTGVTDLDDWLPVGGLRFDTITEWVSEHRGSGAITLAFLAAVNCLQSSLGSGGPLVVVSEGESFYPPSAIAFGIPARRILWVRTHGKQEQVWAVDQALRCKSVRAVLALLPNELDDRDARRFQLASEQGKTPGLFVRPRFARSQPCFAELRFHVDCCQRISRSAATHPSRDEKKSRFTPDDQGFPFGRFVPWVSRSRQFQITLDRCRGGQIGRQGRFEMNELGEVQEVLQENKGALNHGKTTVHLVSKLAHPANSKSKTAVIDCAG